MMPQFLNVKFKMANYENISKGLTLFIIGLSKKVIIADSLALHANSGFANYESLHFFASWITTLSYTFQLYFDFSGYSDMAIGSAFMIGINLPINFNSPYKATNLQDFWRRWHMTLSRFLRDYIYIPLGGNRINFIRTVINVLVTFLIAGIWHGAGWNFIFWGLLHGIGLTVLQIKSHYTIGPTINPRISKFTTFLFVHCAWIFFRAPDVKSASSILYSLVNIKEMVLPGFLQRFSSFLPGGIEYGGFTGQYYGTIYTPLILLCVAYISFNNKNSNELLHSIRANSKTGVILAFILFYICSFKISGYSEFLYFNF